MEAACVVLGYSIGGQAFQIGMRVSFCAEHSCVARAELRWGGGGAYPIACVARASLAMRCCAGSAPHHRRRDHLLRGGGA